MDLTPAQLAELASISIRPESIRSVTSRINTDRSIPLLPEVRGDECYQGKLSALANQLVDELVSPWQELVRSSQRNRGMYTEAARHLLHSLAYVTSHFVALENVGVSLNRNDYSGEGKPLRHLAYDPFRIMVRLFGGLSPLDNNWIVSPRPLCIVRRGVRYDGVSLRTRLVPTTSLKDMLVRAGLVFGNHPYRAVWSYDPNCPLLFLDGEPLLRDLTPQEAVLPLANELISNTTIEMKLLSFSEYHRGWDFRDNRSRLQLHSAVLDRRFKGDEQSGGRLFCNLQNLPKWSRHRLTFNGEETCEYDFSGMQLHLAYSSVGATCSLADPYVVDSGDRDTREFNKKAFVVSVGCEPGDHVSNSVRNSWHEQTGVWIDPALQHERLELFWSVHAPIVGMIGTGAWRHLQRVESEIALDVLGRLTAKNIPCLPLHDGFRVPLSARNDLVEAMGGAANALTSKPAIKEVRPD